MALSTAEEHVILSNSGTAQEIEQGPASPGFQPPPADRAKGLVLEKASSLDRQIATGNEHNYRCQAKDKKNSEINKKKRLESDKVLSKQETESGKKNREK